ncbi:DoxX family protein [Arenimonas oryziterrae]|uniref:DoxX family protein n=1 Tax=Arenimonas oryziterrae DSM 21050 = YC6267 TaxID=1121015 RepID=A0A091AQN6_9GAMM|nr:DoxX family protein [Arenimonas oryziterrae]KFN41334.1 hypothetical protein N789_05515 [Arenimonas oryziterrae DSM 21050 = YC6267]
MSPTLTDRWQALTERLDGVGDWLAPLGLRLLLAWEFWESGIEKYRGENWFADIQSSFPFPFNHVPANISWGMATWFEILGALALLFGLGTRFFAFSLLVLTMVATAAVHWPADWMSLSELAKGYAISNEGFGNFKLPLIFAVMLLPLVFRGAGCFSLDALLAKSIGKQAPVRNHDTFAWSLGLFVLGLPLITLMPALGAALVAIAVLLALTSAFLFA